MICAKCESERIAAVTSKCDDKCYIEIDGECYNGQVPINMNIGSGRYLEFIICLNCGYVDGEWPCPITEIELDLEIKLPTSLIFK